MFKGIGNSSLELILKFPPFAGPSPKNGIWPYLQKPMLFHVNYLIMYDSTNNMLFCWKP